MQNEKKHQNITLSFPTDLTLLLHTRLSRRGISKYVAEAVRNRLEEDSVKELQKLEAAYEEATKDPDRLKTIQDWDSITESDSDLWEWKDG